MRVLLDCDGVLLDWEASFREWVTARLRRPIAAEPSDWDLSKWLRVDREEADNLVRSFNLSKAFGNLAPVYGSQWALSALVEVGAEIHVITSCSSLPNVRHARSQNLVAVFGDVFASITCLPLHGTKTKALAEHAPGAIWVEDNFTNATVGHHLGHQSFVLRRPHNKAQDGKPGPTWCDDWPHVLNTLVSSVPQGGALGDAIAI